MGNNVVAIIQARMGAHRLPNKMLLPLKGRPIIDWVYRRVCKAKTIDQVVVAIPDGQNDQPLADFLQQISANVFRGNENDVVERFYNAAKKNQASHIVRICADNPFICPDAINELVDFYFKTECDYAYNHIPKNNFWPDGLGAEMVNFSVLKRIFEQAETLSQREHLFNYIWDHASDFRIKTFDPRKEMRHPEIKLDIDHKKDLAFLEQWDISIDMSGFEIIQLINKKGNSHS